MCKKSVRWLYKIDENFSWESGHQVPEDLVFRDKTGKVRLLVEKSGCITVTKGYAWNGCSPKFCVFDLLLGTPDGVVHVETEKPKTYFASLIHDALYQFLRDGLPLRRYHADAFFRRLMKESDFAPRWIYWVAVRVLGWFVWFATKQKRNWEGERQRVVELFPSDRLTRRTSTD